MRHQEMLGTFTMKFGARRQLEYTGAMGDFDSGGISPRNSMVASFLDVNMDGDSLYWEEERLEEEEAQELEEEEGEDEEAEVEVEAPCVKRVEIVPVGRRGSTRQMGTVAGLARFFEQMKDS